MKKGILMLAAILAITFTSCKNNEKGSEEMNSNDTEMSNNSKGNSDMNSNKEGMSKMDNSSQASMDNQNGEYPVMKFDEKMHDFGTIPQDEKASHTFTFTNTGEAPLQITKAKGSCGCTVPEWPREAIAPGETGKIKVTFNPRGKKNKQIKSVTLTTNTQKGKEVLRISANVEAKS